MRYECFACGAEFDEPQTIVLHPETREEPEDYTCICPDCGSDYFEYKPVSMYDEEENDDGNL